MSTYHNPAIVYRPEIDGLRAVAVLPVILFHAGFKLFSGGYVGVDIFFVISGYLITSILLRELAQGQFSLVRFYERRARRILPALFFVILCCLPFAWMWMLPDELKRFGQSLIAVATFSSNMYFWRTTDYFAPAAEEQPLLHTWSLAVEEQYYLLFPIFLMLCWRLSESKLGESKLGKSKLFWITVIASIVSLALAEWGWRNNPEANFYLLPTRAWELLAGSLIAFIPQAKAAALRSGLAAQVASSLGLLLIFFSILGYDEFTPFPSIYAVVPVLGAVLVVVFASRNNLAGRLLSSKGFVGLGLISYSAYLWHQPLFSFLRIKFLDRPPPLDFALGAVAAIGLAYLTWRYVEKPFRAKRFDRTKIFSLTGAGLTAMLAVGFAWHLGNGFSERFHMLDDSVLTTFERAQAKCFDRPASANEEIFCAVANDEKVTSADYLVLGDSHMYSALPAFKLWEEKQANEGGMQGAYIGYSGCPPLVGVYALRGDQNVRNCKQLNTDVLNAATKAGIKEVFLLARWTYYTDGGYSGEEYSFIGLGPGSEKNQRSSREAFTQGLKQTISSWTQRGVKVRIIGQVPQQKYNPKDIYFAAAEDQDETVLTRLSVDTLAHQHLQNWVQTAFVNYAAEHQIQWTDPAELMCVNGKCPVGSVSTSYYFDDDHLSIEGAKRLGVFLLEH